VKRSELGPGRKSLERGSTFATKPHGLKRSAPAPRRAPISPASDAQRARVRGRVSIVSGQRPCDPAHLWPRGMGGCDHPDCVVPLTREEHRAYDAGELDLLPYLVARGCFAEMAHVIGAHGVSPVTLVERLTGERWAPEKQAA
jgi:hypothetical protein